MEIDKTSHSVFKIRYHMIPSHLSRASRWGIGSILLLFTVGAVLFYFVDEDRGRAEIAVLSGE